MKRKIDIVHVPYTSNSKLVYPVLLVKKLIDIPYIITIHGGGIYAWKPRIPHQLFFKYATDIVAVSKSIKTEYEKRTGRNIKVIPPLLPFEKSKLSKDGLRKKYNFKDNDIVILCLGSLKEIKGSTVLLDAFINLGEKYIKENNPKLLYVGEGVLRKQLERKIDEKIFGQYVKFLGNIPHEKVPDMFRLADIYVISSLFEGTPIALLEAMFNGLPIIGTNVNGINNLITHKKNGLLFEKKNSDDLKNKIRELLDDTNLANRLGSSAKNDYSTGLTFENVVSDHIKLYKEIVER